MKHAWIREHRDSFGVVVTCGVLGVSRSGYYVSIDRPVGPRAERTAKIEASVRQVFDENDSIYGSAKIAVELEEREDLEHFAHPCSHPAMGIIALRVKTAGTVNLDSL